MEATGRFYRGLLGLTLVKQTVSPDDPYTPLWMFGDRLGTPGTQIHVLFYPRSTRGVVGIGSVGNLILRIPRGSSGYWEERLQRSKQGGYFQDPDGFRMSFKEGAEPTGWEYDPSSTVPPEYAVRGIDSVTVVVNHESREHWGMFPVGLEPGTEKGALGYGVAHHVAFLGEPEGEQYDRYYSRSSYFYGPCGLLGEWTTEEPGPTIDEKPERLGESLCLPPWYEKRRAEIESVIRSMK